MRDIALELFDEFATSYSRGQEPDLREFLSRAGDDAEAFARLVDVFLAGVEPPPAPPDRVEAMRAWVRGEPPLLELRKARRLKRAQLVTHLVELLGLKPGREAKVARYYHELEAGLLDTRGVDARVWDALRQVLGADVRSLARWRPPPAPPEPAVMYRLHEPGAAKTMTARAAAPEEDEVDRLFRSRS